MGFLWVPSDFVSLALHSDGCNLCLYFPVCSEEPAPCALLCSFLYLYLLASHEMSYDLGLCSISPLFVGNFTLKKHGNSPFSRKL